MWYKINIFLKRFFDLFFSSIAMVLLSPLFFIIAIAIKMDSKGPVLFKQERRTKNGKIFNMYKFRSMVVDAEKRGTGLFNFSNDPRVTRVGRLLRKTSMDELPQLWNVFKGDISIVGPRPCVTYELGEYDTLNQKYKKRFLIKGGITGLAQVKGRNENSWDEKVTFDNQYIDEFKQQGIWLDIKIIFETIIKVFKKQDICEKKVDEELSDEKAARIAEEEIIRIAHLPDEIIK